MITAMRYFRAPSEGSQGGNRQQTAYLYDSHGKLLAASSRFPASTCKNASSR